jgi:short-subunit dehydrogenase
MQLQGATVLLTGASGGIGRAVAQALDERGARVLLNARRAEVLEEIRVELDGRPHCLPGDLSDPAGAASLANRAGAVDVLVANAALPASGRVERFSAEEIDAALDVNLRAPIQLTRALLPGMLERGRGHLVYVSSLSGKVASPRGSLYSATKFGLRGFAAGLRQDVEPNGVGVTVVYPGFISEAGMFANSGARLPPWVGTRTPRQVAQAVAGAIESGRAEVDVAPLSLRAASTVASLAPVTVARLQRRLGSATVADSIAEGQRPSR